MRYAMDQNYDYLVNMDADFSHHPRYLPAVLAGMVDKDVTIGSRYVQGGGTENWPLERRLMSMAVGSNDVSILLGSGAKQANGSSASWTMTYGPRFNAGGIGTNHVSIGNYNGDTVPDLLVSNGQSGNVTMLPGIGSAGTGTGFFNDTNPQGQLQLKRCSAEDFEHEVLVPAATAAFHDDAGAAVRMLF